MGPAAAKNDPANWRLAIQAWLTRAQVDFVFQLKKSTSAVRIHIVGNRGATESNRFSQYCLDRGMQSSHFRDTQSASPTTGSNSGAKQTLVGVDVADPMQECLIQERGLDGSFPTPKQRAKLSERNIERLAAFTDKASGWNASLETRRLRPGFGKIQHGKPPETSRVDKPNFAVVVELDDDMRVQRHRHILLRYQQTSGHP